MARFVVAFDVVQSQIGFTLGVLDNDEVIADIGY